MPKALKQKQEYGIPLSRYTVFLQNCPLGHDPNERLLFEDAVKAGHISAEERDVNDEYPIHWHNYFEIELILDGGGTHTLNGTEHPISKGSAYILTPTDFHTLSTTDGTRLWNISFDEEMLSERRFCQLSSIGAPLCFQLDGETLDELSQIAGLISIESSQSDSGCSRELLNCLFTVLFRSGGVQSAERGGISGIRKALLYLEMHFREAPTLAQVASHAGFHPNYLSELFKKVTGQSYSERLNTLRIGYSKTLLSEGFSVSEACYRSGFGSLSNFLLVFKKYTGLTPEEYKRKKT